MSDAQPNGQFTPEKVHDLLVTKVLKGEKLPPRNDPPISDLCHSLNALQCLVKLRTVHWKKSSDRRQQLASAMIVMDEVLPQLGSEVAEALGFASDDGNVELTRQYREALGVISNLSKAVTAAGECALLLHPTLRLPATVRWEQYARDLMARLHQVLPCSKESGYRFLVAVMPDITGETPTLDAVKSHLKNDRPVRPAKNRPVNRGK